ncbi:MAG: hypothetical protein JWN23_997 [Rhodocyclales bacterium]|nr:hypothetical protein [Rhodocyclales bacterium]
MRPARLYHALTAVAACVALAVWLWTWPLNPLWALMLIAGCGVLLWRVEFSWLVLLPLLWPVIDLVPQTGRMYFTESDALAVLTIGVLSVRHACDDADRHRVPWGLTLLFSLIGLSYLISDLRALWPLPALDDNAFIGVFTPWNALRLSKAFVLASLLLPHWLHAQQRDEDKAQRMLLIGMACGILMAALAALWERLAFTGLTDLASDYRTTVLFWEMNTGGAALDGWLMLGMPFVVVGLLRAHSIRTSAFFGMVLLLGAYAALTTFSRGVYLGLALMVVVSLLAWLWQQRGIGKPRSYARLAVSLALPLLLAAMAIPVFHGGGYRGLAALMGGAALVFSGGGLLRPMKARDWLAALALAIPVIALSYALHAVFYKAAYILCGIAFLSAMSAQWQFHRRGRTSERALVGASTLWAAAAVGWICWHWGGDSALAGGITASVLLMTALLVQTFSPVILWRAERQQYASAAVALLIVACVAVGGGSYFLGQRVSGLSEDIATRESHWHRSISLLQSDADWIAGIGVGQFAQHYFWSDITGMPGTWRIGRDADSGNYLQMLGPHYERLGSTELLRITQFLGLNARGPYAVRLRARAPEIAALHIEVSHKQLLYPGPTVSVTFNVPAGNQWTTLQGRLQNGDLEGGKWYAPSITTFSVAVRSMAKRIDVDDIELIDASGVSVLRNSGFERGGDYWFYTSDRVHLPWHAKSIFIHLLVEHGVIGLAVVSLALMLAAWQLLFGRAAKTPLAPTLLAAFSGFLTVGLFDSLLDVPRVAFVFFLLLGVSLGLRPNKN